MTGRLLRSAKGYEDAAEDVAIGRWSDRNPGRWLFGEKRDTNRPMWEFSGFDQLTDCDKVSIEMLNRPAVMANPKTNLVVHFAIRDAINNRTLFEADLNQIYGFEVRSVTDSSETLMKVEKVGKGTERRSNTKAIGKLIRPGAASSWTTLYKIGEVSENEQYSIQSMTNEGTVSLSVLSNELSMLRRFQSAIGMTYYGKKKHKFYSHKGTVPVASVKPAMKRRSDARIYKIRFTDADADIQTRAAILGTVLLLTIVALPELAHQRSQ